jgi:hypothetical protein
MIPFVITETQRWIAELYWGCSWTCLSAPQVQEALDWFYAVEEMDD